jgi:hypothetical protein
VTAWWPDIVSWGSDGVTHRRWLPGDGTFVDGSIVGYIVGSDGSDNDVGLEFKLILADPFPPVLAGSAGEAVGIAKRRQMIVDWTLGQVISSHIQI